MEEPAVHAHHQHGGHVEQEVAERDDEGGEGGALERAEVHDAHPVAVVDAALLAAQVQQHEGVAEDHQHQRQEVEAE